MSDFLDEAYNFFAEADFVARFQNYLESFDSFAQKATTTDGHVVGLIHREYPTFFRFSAKSPTKQLGPPAKRGHYDIVLLSPEFVKAHIKKGGKSKYTCITR